MVGRWSRLAFGRVNALVPALAILAGAALAMSGRPWIGTGIALGAVLALINSIILSHRVEMAADLGDVGRALMVMQVGLFVTFFIIGIATIILVKISLSLAVSAAGGFGITQLALLAVFFFTRGRGQVIPGGNTL